jgi:intein/homing endonuclease
MIRINDKEIKKFLIENDYDNKSFASPDKILNIIPENIKRYFFRGLVDGDGCFCSKNRNYFSITGNINQKWNSIIDLFNSLDVKFSLTKKKRNTGSSSYITVSSKIDILKIGEYLYDKDFDFGLMILD